MLLIDLDPQSCLTFSLGIDPEELATSVHTVLLRQAAAADVILATEDSREVADGEHPLTLWSQQERKARNKPWREQAVSSPNSALGPVRLPPCPTPGSHNTDGR